MNLPFAQIDAFTFLKRPFTGNPAAVMLLDRWLDDALLQRIAAENNLSETAFLVATTDDSEAEYELRWFTPAVEIEMCGHATLASGHYLLQPGQERIRFRTRKAGILEVARFGGDQYALSLPARLPEPKPLPAIVAALELHDVVETLWHPAGFGFGVIVVANADSVSALIPDFARLAAASSGMTIVTAPGITTDIVSRAFAPGAGIDEDPVTGAAHAVLTPYWAKRLGRTHFTALQASARGGILHCTLAGDRVMLGGSCVTVIEGSFRIA